MTHENGTPRVLLVDDDVELSELLGEYLESEGFSVSVALDGQAGLEAAGSGEFSAVILDIMLPRVSGVEVLRRIRAESRVPIIMLTAKGDDVDRVVGLELGADDYVAKPYYAREIVARLRAVLRRQAAPPEVLPPSVVFGPLKLEVQIRRVAVGSRELQLTATEFDFLLHLIRSGARVATRQDLSLKILNRVWQAYDRSVDVHINNLRQKLSAVTREVEIETIRGLGYRVRTTA